MRVLRAESDEQWTAWAADEFVAAAAESYRRAGQFHVVLPGGGTPRTVLRRVAAEYGAGLEDVWRTTHVYFGDERGVGPDHEDSNYRMVRESWLRYLPVPEAQVHRIRGELDLESAAVEYRDIVGKRLGASVDAAGASFDLVVLGIGPDGHTASLIPGVELDFVADPWVGVGPAPLSPAQVRRVTLTAEALRRTRRSVFWAKGDAKAEVVRAAITGEGMRTIVPEVVPPGGDVTWLLDSGSAPDQALFFSSSRISPNS